MKKELRSLFDGLEAQGWTIRSTKKGWFAVPPDPTKAMVLIHGSSSEYRSWKNTIAELKRSGYVEG